MLEAGEVRMRGFVFALIFVVLPLGLGLAQKSDTRQRHELRHPGEGVRQSVRQPKKAGSINLPTTPRQDSSALRLKKLEQSSSKTPVQAQHRGANQPRVLTGNARPGIAERNVPINFPGKPRKTGMASTANPVRRKR